MKQELVTIVREEVAQRNQFSYLGYIILNNGGIVEDTSRKIKTRRLKWQNASEVLYDMRIPTKLKEKFWTAKRPSKL